MSERYDSATGLKDAAARVKAMPRMQSMQAVQPEPVRFAWDEPEAEKILPLFGWSHQRAEIEEAKTEKMLRASIQKELEPLAREMAAKDFAALRDPTADMPKARAAAAALAVLFAMSGCSNVAERRLKIIHEGKILVKHWGETDWASRKAVFAAECEQEDPTPPKGN